MTTAKKKTGGTSAAAAEVGKQIDYLTRALGTVALRHRLTAT